jgi:hypothetical protein
MELAAKARLFRADGELGRRNIRWIFKIIPLYTERYE